MWHPLTTVQICPRSRVGFLFQPASSRCYWRPPGGRLRLAMSSCTEANIVHSPEKKNTHNVKFLNSYKLTFIIQGCVQKHSYNLKGDKGTWCLKTELSLWETSGFFARPNLNGLHLRMCGFWTYGRILTMYSLRVPSVTGTARNVGVWSQLWLRKLDIYSLMRRTPVCYAKSSYEKTFFCLIVMVCEKKNKYSNEYHNPNSTEAQTRCFVMHDVVQ